MIQLQLIPLQLADTGVPMLFVWEPVLLLGLVPIVLIEMAVFKRVLAETWARCFVASLIANLVSAAVGVPITWVALMVLQMAVGGDRAHGVGVYAITVQAPWLIPYEEHLHWMVPAAGLVLCVPFFLTSVLCEWPVVTLTFRHPAPWTELRATIAANLASYALIGAFWLVMLLWNWK